VSNAGWLKYEDQKPTEGRYWFRVASKYYEESWSGHRVEFVDVMRMRGNGYQPAVLSPAFDHWDGYSIHIPTEIEWKPVTEDKILAFDNKYLLNKYFIHIPTVTVNPCPFCGEAPNVSWTGQWIGAPVWKRDRISIKCCVPNIEHWETSFTMLLEKWNKRVAKADGAPS
jgi:hypothetical protein